MSQGIVEVPLNDAARQKYINYAISVITSRALPDVRDGLKPVQRRILYAMYKDLKLLPERKALKCAKVVGEVLGNYHPHGDSAVYDAMVRMAQDWVLRVPLVDGHGNFGSLDGDRAAAYRYTEARLRQFAISLIDEIGQDTVDFRETFDGAREEPVVLPAQAPLLLVNGASGIAVGIATNIPPHNLTEVVKASVKLIENPGISLAQLTQSVKGPDFPTGAEILNSKREITKIYKTGSGPIRMRSLHKLEGRGKKKNIIITAIPYMVKKQDLVGKIRDLALDKKIPQIRDVRDESTTDVRIVLDLKSGADPDKIMAYLYKATDLQSNFHVNMTCLVPLKGTDIAAPRQLDLKGMLQQFLTFRHGVVRRRFEYELNVLRKRLHILDGFALIFRGLDDAIEIIRNSKGKQDAGNALKKKFKLDEIQVNAILEMMLYRIASLEIKRILSERKEKKERAAEIEAILKSTRRLWSIVKQELRELGREHGDRRRTQIAAPGAAEVVEISDDDFIVEEDQYITLTTGGWVKRVGTITTIDKISVKQGDTLLAVAAGSTKSTVVFFSNKGAAYTARINDLPASRGYGEPIQKHFKFKDGERVVAMMSFDRRAIGNISIENEDYEPEIHGLAISSSGFGLRFALSTFEEPSTRVGRKFSRVTGDTEIVNVFAVDSTETVICVSEQARALLCPAEEIKYLEGAGKGVYVLKVAKDDRVIGATVTREDHKGLTAVTSNGTPHNINPRRYRVTGRAGKGFQVIKRGTIKELRPSDIEIPKLK